MTALAPAPRLGLAGRSADSQSRRVVILGGGSARVGGYAARSGLLRRADLPATKPLHRFTTCTSKSVSALVSSHTGRLAPSAMPEQCQIHPQIRRSATPAGRFTIPATPNRKARP